jgi:hypothetical protein
MLTCSKFDSAMHSGQYGHRPYTTGLLLNECLVVWCGSRAMLGMVWQIVHARLSASQCSAWRLQQAVTLTANGRAVAAAAAGGVHLEAFVHRAVWLAGL